MLYILNPQLSLCVEEVSDDLKKKHAEMNRWP